MPDEIKADKSKFGALFRKIARTPTLKEDEQKVGPIPGRLYRSKKKPKVKLAE
jgi:hypothetical protein